MRVGVAPQFIAVRKNALHQRRIGLRIRADHEERRLHVLAFENVENLRRPLGIGAVVEGERDLLLRRAELPDHITGRQFGIGFVVYVAELLVDFEGARAGLRMRDNFKDFALAFVVNAFHDRDVMQRIGCR